MTELVVKDNALIQASYTLDLVEQRLMLLAIMEARETGKGIAPDSLLQVHAHSYAEHFNINKETAYTVMKDASKGLFDRYVTYHDKNPKTGKDRSFHCRWVDKIGYEKDTGIVYLRFTHDVVPLITRLEQQFTSYDIEQISSLNSGYAIRLYELLIQWRSVGKTPVFELQQFRQQLGVEEIKYSRMSDFKKYVLDFAVLQINEHTDIAVKYDQHKQGRVITGFTFKFKVKAKSKKAIESKRDSNTPDMLTAIKMTDKQRGTFASKLSQMGELSSYAKQGEDYKQFAARIESELLDESKQVFYIPYLDKLGFQPS
ncbi:replication initiation protein RepM [Psychrobacter sp. APC 3350]|uniref:replication initiation protein RepM n=1 Tax=Psychrobacter sp. APC 3350 TaxID=3035195 RepID=UPI0025B35239|nr:replication initiation protein RepM [Psychrobacter sp. APC 3350]MDN3454526.1 replication initiation protein RepM [Psychrobacter sp. APC 3350]